MHCVNATSTVTRFYVAVRDVWKPNFGSVSVLKIRTEPKPKGRTRNFGFQSVAFLKTELVSYK